MASSESDAELAAFIDAVVNEEYKNPSFSEPNIPASASKSARYSNFPKRVQQNYNGNCIVLTSVYYSSKEDGWQPSTSKSSIHRVEIPQSNRWLGEEIMPPRRSTFDSIPARSPKENTVSTTPSTTPTDNRETQLLSNPKPFTCSTDECSRVFLDLNSQMTYRKIHAAQKPYLCPWKCCGKRFSRRDRRKRHYRSHTGIKPYKCQYCGRFFSRLDHKNCHLRTCSIHVGQH